jgi:hypothetical protein
LNERNVYRETVLFSQAWGREAKPLQRLSSGKIKRPALSSMSVSSQSKGGNFVFIRNKDKPSAEPKKVPRPSTLAALKRSAAQALSFPQGQAIQAMYDESGTVITTMKQVTIGAKILVSIRSPDEAFPTVSFGGDEGPRGLAGGLNTPASRQGRPVRGSSSLLVLSEDGMSYTSRRPRSEFALAESIDLPEDTQTDEVRYDQTGISIQAIATLVRFWPASLMATLDEACDLCPAQVTRFMSATKKREKVLGADTYHSILRLIGDIPEAGGSVVKRARDLVDKATFTSSFDTFTRLRTAIVGPPKSGKTFFLRVLSRVLVSVLLAGGQEKRMLVVYLDVANIVESITDPVKLYGEIVRVTFNHLAAQRLDIAPFSASLIAYFKKLTIMERLVPLPQQFLLQDEFRDSVPLLNSVAKDITQSFHVERSLSHWLLTVFAFPKLVAFSLGFSTVQFIIDHFDLTDVDLVPDSWFSGASAGVTLIEAIKRMVVNQNYIIGCVSESRLLPALDSSTDDGVDLRNPTELVNVVDIDTGHADRYVFFLTLKNEPHPLRLGLQDCGGCPGYLEQWDRLILQSDQLVNEEKRDHNSRTSKELRLSLLRKIRALSSVVLFTVSEDGTRTPVDKQVVDFVIRDTGTELNLEGDQY